MRCIRKSESVRFKGKPIGPVRARIEFPLKEFLSAPDTQSDRHGAPRRLDSITAA
jgi:hypothetical protein